MVPDLGGLRIVVTGRMGLAIAVAGLRRGADVTLISSPPDPTVLGLRFVPISTVASLRAAVLRACANAHIVVMAAAVSDFEPVPDFMHEVGEHVFKVDFSAFEALPLLKADAAHCVLDYTLAAYRRWRDGARVGVVSAETPRA
jgi:NAD(P)-dependent dehydrogenase (short-subunit alcohol dehydrogenase family)